MNSVSRKLGIHLLTLSRRYIDEVMIEKRATDARNSRPVIFRNCPAVRLKAIE